MGFGKHLEALVAEVDLHLGDRARWEGVPGEVPVHPVDEDGTARFGQTELIVETRSLQVHRSHVPEPYHGQLVELLDDAGGLSETVKVRGDPQIDSDGYWLCSIATA